METKILIRKNALQLRDRLAEQERMLKSKQIMQSVAEHSLYQNAENLLIYISYKSEVDTSALIEMAWKDGKKVYCPKVQGTEMEFYRIMSMEELEDGYKGIREPVAAIEKSYTGNDFDSAKDSSGLLLMPGSAFDKQRNRIGYGGGYYDKYLAKHPKLHTIAVCFECQIQKSIPSEPYDWKPQVLVTECNTYQEV